MMPLLACALLVITGANLLALMALRRFPKWKWRREAQLAVLAAPLFGLFLGLVQVSECGALTCGAGSAFLPVDAIGRVLITAMALLVVGAAALGIGRAVLLLWVVRRDAMPAGADLEQQAKRLARALGVVTPRVRLRPSSEPLALTFGFRRPTLLLSTWMVEQLDRCELEAVLAHELAHAARHDYLVLWLATVLRDAFWYLPTSRMAHALLHTEKEIACDDLALTVTHRPLGLAGALAKVWRHAVTPGSPAASTQAVRAAPDVLTSAQGLVTAGELIHGRITRLLHANAGDPTGSRHHDMVSLPVMTARVAGLLVGTGALLVVALLVMGCGHALVG